MRSLPYQGAKHSAVDHGDASDSVFLQLWGHCGRASTSSSTCGRLLGLDESFSQTISSILYQYNLSTMWTTSQVYSFVSHEWLRVEFTLKMKRGSNRHTNGVGRMPLADWPGPNLAWFGRPFLHVDALFIFD
jgi:hypothetical protein